MNESQRTMLDQLGKEFNIIIDNNAIEKMTKEEMREYMRKKEEELFNNLFNTTAQS